MGKFENVLLAAAASLFAAGASAAADAPGFVLAAVSDGDQDALSYGTGALAPASRPDWLSVYADPIAGKTAPDGAVRAPNSNYSPSGVLVLAPDGRWAYGVETMARRKGGVRLSDLAPSNRLIAYDLRDLARPRIVNEVAVGARPRSLDIARDGRTVIVLSNDQERPLAFARIAEGRLAEPASFKVPGAEGGQREFSFVRWSPADDLAAVHMAAEGRIIFLRILRDAQGGVAGVAPHGNPVTVNKFPMTGAFTPDGRYYVTSDVGWGADTRGYSAVTRGMVSLVEIGRAGPDGAVRNQLVDFDIGGRSAESIAISPDGRYVVTSSIETTALPAGAPTHDALALLTLYAIDAESGRIARVDAVRFNGLLPQGLAFDPAGARIFVGVNELVEDRTKGGVLVFALETRPAPRLIDTGRRLTAPPGVHTLAAAPRAPQ